MPRTGRPREFDRERAMETAMNLFWSQGYEPTSLNQLKESMGRISPASFYAAFGSKERLFREVVQRYMRTHGRVAASLWDETIAPRDAIEHALRASARMQTECTHPAGCLIALAARNCSPENQHIEALLAAERARSREGIKACVDRAITQGELKPSTNADGLAMAFDTFLTGMASQSRDGANQETLDAAITALLQLWDINRVRPNEPGWGAS